jgi:hypothetical protein
MSLFTPKTQLQSDLETKDSLLLATGEAMHHLASTLQAANVRFWSLPDERLLALLNNDIAQTLGTFQANTVLGAVLNAQLDALDLPQFPTRAPVEMGRSDVAFEDGAFVILPPEPIEIPSILTP